MKRVFTIVMTLLLTVSLLTAGAYAADNAVIYFHGTADYEQAEALFSLVNDYRTDCGLEPLILDNALTEAAMQRAAELSLQYSHTRPDGTEFPSVIGNEDLNELIGSSLNANDLMNAWKLSIPHVVKLLDRNATHTGIGCAVIHDSIYWVQLTATGGNAETDQFSEGAAVEKLFPITVPAEDLAPMFSEEEVSITVDPNEEEPAQAAFAMSYQYGHSIGAKWLYPVPYVFCGADGSLTTYTVTDDSGSPLVTLTYAPDTMEIIATPAAEEGSVTVALPMYAEETAPVTVTFTVHTHVYTTEVYEPTCESGGFTLYTCEICNGGCMGDYTDAVDCEPAEELAWAEEPTCTTEGYSGDVVCKWCETLLEEGTVLEMLPHTPSDWIEDPELTDEYGTAWYMECTVCGEVLDTKYDESEPPMPPTVPTPFADVADDAYYFDSVIWAVENGITTGTGPNRFSPDKACTRGEVVTFLWRAAGCPNAGTEDNPFTDVSAEDYYYEAVLWAVEKGITLGISPTEFAPNKYCTRAEVVTFLWRANGNPETETRFELFLDVSYRDYYYHPVLWAVENDVTKGTSLGIFSPDMVCSRAQIVTFLYRS